MTMSRTTAPRSRCPSAGSASATPRTSPSASPRRSSTSTGTSSAWRDDDRRAARAGPVLPAPRRPPRPRRHGRGLRDRLPVPRLEVRRRGRATPTSPTPSARTRRARCARFPVVERNGVSLRLVPPRRRRWRRCGTIRELPEFNGDPEWSTVIRTEHTVETPWQEMAENGVDSAHFRFVHNTAEVPVMESYETGFPGTQMRSCQKFPTPRGVMEGRIDSESIGPGIAIVRFAGIVDTMSLAVTTPITADQCITRFNFRFKTMGDEETTRNVGQAFVQRGRQAVPRGQADLGAQGPPRAAGAGRQRRPVHEVPQVGARSSTPRASATSARCSRRRGGPTAPTRRPPRPPPARSTATDAR